MSRPWMPLDIAGYLADTTHLNVSEHGALMLLVMHHWRRGYLPSDDGRLAQIARASQGEWAEMRPALSEFFDERWRLPRGKWGIQ